MVDNQHKKITGYRDLSEVEIAAMNEVKQIGATIESILERLKNDPSIDPRWLAIGKTHLQQGLMSVVRAIAKPESF